MDVTKFTCDYYDLLAGKKDAINRFQGEYMFEYSWSENTISWLEKLAEKFS